jgi:ribosomal protein S18 acetylase RimI-like enzyme
MNIQRVTTADSVDIHEINRLLQQQSPGTAKTISSLDLTEALKNPNFCLLVAKSPVKEREIVGMATVFLQRNLARWMAEIHDVVVDQQERGQGVGESLVQSLLALVDEFAVRKKSKIKVYLTSRPSRQAANALYIKLGFTLVAQSTGNRGTNLYKKMAGM